MNYSTALLESIEAAQILAGHYQGNTLDTWHLLTAMANNPYSVAGSVLNDYPMQIDEFQDAAEHITGQAFQSDNRYEIFPFSYRMEAIMKHAREIAQVLHAKTLGTEHVLLSLLADVGPWLASHGVCRLCLYRARQGCSRCFPSKESRRQGRLGQK